MDGIGAVMVLVNLNDNHNHNIRIGVVKEVEEVKEVFVHSNGEWSLMFSYRGVQSTVLRTLSWT